MSATDRNNNLPQQERIFYTMVACLVLLGAVYAVLWEGNRRAGLPTEGVLIGYFTGATDWTPHHTAVTLTGLAVVAAAWPALWWVDRRLFGPRRPVTRAAKHFASVWKARKLTKRYRLKETAARGTPYLPMCLGYLGRTRIKLYMGPEDTLMGTTGPRENKSSSTANPAIVEAPAGCLSTSNKPDPIHDTMHLREGPIYIFDPQNLYHGHDPNPMFWNPLSIIRDADDTHKNERASTLAQRLLFAASTANDNMDFWQTSGKNILSALLLAATVAERPITDAYRWALVPNDVEPVKILETDGRFLTAARTLDAYAHHPEETRGGEYATVQTALAFLNYDSVVPWITPGHGRVEFNPSVMVAGGKPTLYVLSQEGEGSTGPLTAALTIAVYDVVNAAAVANTANKGRLDLPFHFVLDEVANVAPWEGLPELMTHMGSKGILPFCLFQNYSQGKRLWGEDRMKVMLSVCSVFQTGGNVKDNGFHESVMNMLPDYRHRNVSQSTGKNGGSESVSYTKEKILNVADLRELPKEYSLMFVANTRVVLLRHIPMWRRGYKAPQKAQAPVTVAAPVTRYTGPAPQDPPRRRSSGWATTLTLEED